MRNSVLVDPSTMPCSWFSAPEGADPSTRSSSSFSATRWTSRLLASQTPVRKPSCRIPLMSSRSLDAAPALCLGCFCYCCVPGTSNVSSRTSVISGLLGLTLSLFCPLHLCLLRCANPTVWVILIPAASNSLRGPQFPRGRIFLKTFPLRHTTAAEWDTFLQVAANFLRDQFLWVSASPCSLLDLKYGYFTYSPPEELGDFK
jgi:hypothetical protein